MRKRTRIAVIALVAMLGIGAAGLAWAYFNATSTATAANGKTGELNGLDMEDETYDYAPAGALYPGHSADVKISVTNVNEVPVVITSVTAAGKSGDCSSNITQSAAAWKLYDSSNTEVANNGYTAFELAPSGEYTLVIVDGVTLNSGATCQNVNNLSTDWTVAIENR